MMGQVGERRAHTRKDCRIPLELERRVRGRSLPCEATR